MKKAIMIVIMAVAGMVVTQASSNSYFLDETSVDALFAQAEMVSLENIEGLTSMVSLEMGNHAFFAQDKDPLVSFLLCWFLGGLGIHRAYMGTSVGTIVAYILTAGGCGIVWTIDWIMLLIGVMDNDISQYIDNPRFFMW